MSGRRGVVLAFVAVLAAGCGDSPVAPSGPVGPAEVTISASPTTARVGGSVIFAVWLSRPLDHGLDIWLEAKSPTSDWGAHRRTGVSAAGEVGRHLPSAHVRAGAIKSNELSSGILTADSVGDYGLRIVGDRLPEGVVLGDPSSVRWTVVP